MRELDPDFAFASAYDVIYREPRAFYASQLDFLNDCFGGQNGQFLDAGCGTGRHVQALAERGYSMVGMDASPAMLAQARARLVQAGLAARLVRADLRALPLAGRFGGILCLESPLAYLLPDADLAAAMAGFWRVLQPGGLLIADIFDYPGTLGPDGFESQTNRFQADGVVISVRESHRPDPTAGLWHMRQEFTVIDIAGEAHALVNHSLSLRPVDEYAAALEAAGFVIEDLFDRYPNALPEAGQDRRMIFVARKNL